VPTVGRSSGKSGQTASQLQRLKMALRIRVAQLHPWPESPGCEPVRLGSGILALMRSTECQGKAFADSGPLSTIEALAPIVYPSQHTAARRDNGPGASSETVVSSWLALTGSLDLCEVEHQGAASKTSVLLHLEVVDAAAGNIKRYAGLDTSRRRAADLTRIVIFGD
jgi:hypothetical protein